MPTMTQMRARSCQQGARRASPARFAADPLDTTALAETLPPNVTVAGGWHLGSDNASFGGLSGLAVKPNGDLLALSDAGILFTIGITDDSISGEGDFIYLRDSIGNLLDGKTEYDAEGLALYDGIAVISFERHHRIDMYDIATCGEAATALRLATLPDKIDGKNIDENRGAEALSITPSGQVVFAYENIKAQSARFGSLTPFSRTEWTQMTIDTPLTYAVVGRDDASMPETGVSIAAVLLRSYDPVRGNRNILRVNATEIEIIKPADVDNFEGVALQPLSPDTVRAWIVSDDNFNPLKQRTLLYAFDIDVSLQ